MDVIVSYVHKKTKQEMSQEVESNCGVYRARVFDTSLAARR